MTVLPEKVLRLWKSFKQVKILASIDAVGDLNYYIRYPTKWDDVEKNLRFIDEHHEEYNITECMLSTTVQALNVLQLPKLYDYLAQFKFIVKAPNLINLHWPSYLQTTVLPQNYKMLATMQLQELQKSSMDRVPPHYSYLIDNLTSVINFMNHTSHHHTHFDQTKRFLTSFDAIKNLKIEDYCPEFSFIMGKK
jgi:sulfatase maturation enzyme AslB (radical SAM superfamily)